ncbi:hypothetical protein [uncultured Flavobacterium sp.]|uniref:hypothetical protein n=1 Tax=uncultured Flavobacterium sp. TaxID=165435 RepID=UPI0025FA7D92|nr:hypothetical protein [uncultured Flavobacterium sp.]
MPASIPFDHPSLILGNVADPKVLTILANISKYQSLIAASQDKLNSFIMMKRSIGMTINELTDLGIDTSALQGKLDEISKSISGSANDYLSARIANEEQIQQQRQQLSALDTVQSVESPVDFSKSKLEKFALASESLKLDSQYFSYGTSLDDNTISSIEKYVRESTASLGTGSEKAASDASAQINMQLQNHSVAGTLIITATCTHSGVKMFEPLVIDPDKAVAAWNSVNKDNAIDTSAQSLPASNAFVNDAGNDLTMDLLTGASYGSSFIGMVHILNKDSGDSATDVSESFKQVLDQKLKTGSWIKGASGGFGVDGSFLREVKQMLSSQEISAHVSVIVLGAVPSIASGKLKMGIKTIADSKPSLPPAAVTATSTPNATAQGAKEDAKAMAASESANNAIIRQLGKIDHKENNVMDINSLMIAFENYLATIRDSRNDVGIPISFMLKKLTKDDIESLWKDKYSSETGAPTAKDPVPAKN